MLVDLPTNKLFPRADARELASANVEALAASIAAIGLIQPLVVVPKDDGWEVQAGSHRLAAHKLLGKPTVPCVVMGASTPERAEMTMIDENVIRKGLTPVERARHLARRKELFVQFIRPDQRVFNGQADAPRTTRERFEVEVSKATGQSAATIVGDVIRGTRVLPEVLDMLSGTALDKSSYLNTLSRMPPSEQYAVAKRDLTLALSKERSAAREASGYGSLIETRKEAAKTIAATLAAHVPKADLPKLRADLFSAGATYVGNALTAVIGDGVVKSSTRRRRARK